MRNYFTFNGMDSRTYGVYISGTGVFNVPQKQYEYISIPGRNGDLIGIEKRMENIELTYPAYIGSNFKTNFRSFMNAMMAVDGYATLSDSYDTTEFRKAAFSGGTEVDVAPFGQGGQFDLTFSCKPQRYLNSGETTQTFTANGTITNPTLFASSPLIRVTGYGSCVINGTTITIINVFPYIDIDSDIMDCYYGTTNANEQVTFSGNDFPRLSSGSNTITITDGTITKIEITPRWWRV